MKKFLGMLGTALVAVLFWAAAGVGFNSCTGNSLGSYIKGPAVDSAQVVDIVNDIINPEFGGVDEVIIYKDFILAKQQIESTFTHLTDKQILDISTVVLKKGIPLSVKSIFDEYMNSKDVYDNLPSEVSTDQTTESNDTTTAMGAPPTPAANPSETSYTSKDTMIDGKRATITTKIEKYE